MPNSSWDQIEKDFIESNKKKANKDTALYVCNTKGCRHLIFVGGCGLLYNDHTGKELCPGCGKMNGGNTKNQTMMYHRNSNENVNKQDKEKVIREKFSKGYYLYPNATISVKYASNDITPISFRMGRIFFHISILFKIILEGGNTQFIQDLMKNENYNFTGNHQDYFLEKLEDDWKVLLNLCEAQKMDTKQVFIYVFRVIFLLNQEKNSNLFTRQKQDTFEQQLEQYIHNVAHKELQNFVKNYKKQYQSANIKDLLIDFSEQITLEDIEEKDLEKFQYLDLFRATKQINIQDFLNILPDTHEFIEIIVQNLPQMYLHLDVIKIYQYFQMTYSNRLQIKDLEKPAIELIKDQDKELILPILNNCLQQINNLSQQIGEFQKGAFCYTYTIDTFKKVSDIKLKHLILKMDSKHDDYGMFKIVQLFIRENNDFIKNIVEKIKFLQNLGGTFTQRQLYIIDKLQNQKLEIINLQLKNVIQPFDQSLILNQVQGGIRYSTGLNLEFNLQNIQDDIFLILENYSLIKEISEKETNIQSKFQLLANDLAPNLFLELFQKFDYNQILLSDIQLKSLHSCLYDQQDFLKCYDICLIILRFFFQQNLNENQSLMEVGKYFELFSQNDEQFQFMKQINIKQLFAVIVEIEIYLIKFTQIQPNFRLNQQKIPNKTFELLNQHLDKIHLQTKEQGLNIYELFYFALSRFIMRNIMTISQQKIEEFQENEQLNVMEFIFVFDDILMVEADDLWINSQIIDILKEMYENNQYPQNIKIPFSQVYDLYAKYKANHKFY